MTEELVLVERYIQQVVKYFYDILKIQPTDNELIFITVGICVIAAVTGFTGLLLRKRGHDNSKPIKQKDNISDNEEDIEFELESIKNEVEHSENAVGIEGELNSIKNKVEKPSENAVKINSDQWGSTKISEIQKHLDFAKRAKNANQYDQALSTCQQVINICKESREAQAKGDTNQLDKINEYQKEAKSLRQSIQVTQDAADEVSETFSQVSAKLSRINDTVGDDPQEAVVQLNSIERQLNAIKRVIDNYGFSDENQRWGELSQQVTKLRKTAKESNTAVCSFSQYVPSEITSSPDLSIKYDEIEKSDIIGRGGDADIYKSRVNNSTYHKQIALKEPRLSGTLHTDVVNRFINEAEIWERLDDHDHIVGVIDWGSDPLPWIALEYMNGGTLADRIGEQSLEESLWIAQSMIEAVHHAHDYGITHLDLKPANVLFQTTNQGTWDTPKVSDWGLAKLLLEHSKSIEGLTPQYAAPEQVDPETYGSTNKQTDIYQLGAVMYEMFTGEPVFSGPPAQVAHKITSEEIRPPTSIDPELPTVIDEILLQSLATKQEDRYEDILYLRDQISTLIS